MSTPRPADHGPQHSIRAAPQAEQFEAAPFGPSPSIWNETELTDALLTVCDEVPTTRMVACWRALEHCRWIPRGTPEALLVMVREILRREIAPASPFAAAA